MGHMIEHHAGFLSPLDRKLAQVNQKSFDLPKETFDTIWLGPNVQAAHQVLLSLQVRWPHAQMVIIDSPQDIAIYLRDVDLRAVFVHLTPEDGRAFEYIEDVRETSHLPILGVDGGVGETARVKAFYQGCDDIIDAGAAPIEVLAITVAILRRVQQEVGLASGKGGTVEFGPLQVCFDTHEVWLDGCEIYLTPTEFRLLRALLRNKGRVVSHVALAHAIWQNEWDGGTGVLRKYIQRLRGKLSQVSEHPCRITSVTAVGYRLVLENSESLSADSIPLAVAD